MRLSDGGMSIESKICESMVLLARLAGPIKDQLIISPPESHRLHASTGRRHRVRRVRSAGVPADQTVADQQLPNWYRRLSLTAHDQNYLLCGHECREWTETDSGQDRQMP